MAHLVAEAVPGTEVREVEWPQDRYFVETGDYISDITRITAPRTGGPEPPCRKGLRAPWLIIGNTGKNTGSPGGWGESAPWNRTMTASHGHDT